MVHDDDLQDVPEEEGDVEEEGLPEEGSADEDEEDADNNFESGDTDDSSDMM